MLCSEVYGYIEMSKGLPFFYVVGDGEYMDVLSELKQAGLEVIRTSQFCHAPDKLPDIDEIIDCFHTLDINFKTNKFVLVGLGEYLALRGIDEIKSTLRRIKNVTLGNARVIILLRGVSNQVRDIINEDNRIVEKKLVFFADNAVSNISITNNCVATEENGQLGVSHLIYMFEEGASGKIEMKSDLTFEDALFPVTQIDRAYTALSKTYVDYEWKEEFGSDAQWTRLLAELTLKPDYIHKCFSSYLNYEHEIYEHVLGEGYRNWIYFLNLKLHRDKIQNKYLSYVVNRTVDFRELKNNLLIEITRVPHNDGMFKELYEGRKKLIKDFPESDIAIFIAENKVNSEEEIYKYTDNTFLERKQIISWIAKNGWDEIVTYIYPDLGQYMKKYLFTCGSVSEQLTDYFERYKRQKVENKITDEFMDLVYKYAQKFVYTKLQTRDAAINKISDKKTTYLYWIDALGVEYLSFIVELAKRKGLSVHIDIARVDLPTITSFNKGFYENWAGAKKYKEEELDEIKHKEKGGFFYTENQMPVHLAKELDIIKRAVEVAATSLAMHECRQFVIASDHGASRLAVIKKDENPHPTDTQGEHSGRCCKIYDESDREYVIEENGYFVRTDYGRYKGSRAANVEVHGGASLEEIVVPIITFKLKKQMDIDIRVLNSDTLQADRHDGTMVELYISDVANVSEVYLVIDGNRYVAQSKDKTHYSVLIQDIKRQKECRADVYDAEDLIGTIQLAIKGKTASVNSDFDDLF